MASAPRLRRADYHRDRKTYKRKGCRKRRQNPARVDSRSRSRTSRSSARRGGTCPACLAAVFAIARRERGVGRRLRG
ncbi:Hypothetical protein BN69_0563 [Methylocystis sp. SC2]|nr:Hypothetical protein BN69_0563 [Methylocystis sp. SC2]